jgi:hypothetical protein
MRTKSTESQRAARRRKTSGIVFGTLVAASECGAPLVDFSGRRSARLPAAKSVVAWGEKDVGRDVALMFEKGNPARPVIVGFPQPAGVGGPTIGASADGERLVLAAEREIVLCCGEASITLTRAGKIILRGTYLLSRSSGVNRIKGAAVQIN